MARPSARKQVVDELFQLSQLVRQSDSIELKVTVPDRTTRSAAAALGVDALQAQIRQVFFFDTPDLRLNQAGVVARARRIQGRDSDSVVKLRPVVPSELPAEVRASPNLVVEVDAMQGGSYVCSAAMKGILPPNTVRETVLEGKPLRKLFSKEQRAFFTAHAPDGIALDDLSVLGPIFVLKLKTYPETFGRKLVAEMWLYPDGSRVVELSAKCLPGEGMELAADMRKLFADKGIDISGEQQTKTKAALEFFSAELQNAKRPSPQKGRSSTPSSSSGAVVGSGSR